MMRTMLLVIGLMVLPAGRMGMNSFVAAEDDGPAKIYYDSGLALFKKNSYDEAVGKFRKALAYRPGFPEASFKLGECYEKLKDNNKAVGAYRTCAASLRQLAERSKEQQEMLVEASKRLDKLDVRGKEVNSAKKNYTDKLLGLARDCISRKYNCFAIWILEEILRIDPDNKAAQELLDKLTGAQGGKTKPAEEKKKAAPEEPKADKRKAKAYLDTSDNYLLKGDYDKALDALADAVKADPKSVENFVNSRPGSEAAKRSIDKVLADLNEKVALNPQFYAAYYVRSVLNAKMGNYRSAVTDANIALKLAPANPFAPELKKLLPKWQERAK